MVQPQAGIGMSLLASCLALCASLAPLPSRANDYTWDNGSGDGTWNNALNWSANIAPTATDGAIFSAANGRIVTLTGESVVFRTDRRSPSAETGYVRAALSVEPGTRPTS